MPFQYPVSPSVSKFEFTRKGIPILTRKLDTLMNMLLIQFQKQRELLFFISRIYFDSCSIHMGIRYTTCSMISRSRSLQLVRLCDQGGWGNDVGLHA